MDYQAAHSGTYRIEGYRYAVGQQQIHHFATDVSGRSGNQDHGSSFLQQE
jgi:hypothetical protein